LKDLFCVTWAGDQLIGRIGGIHGREGIL
jgi:hypothetical protein